MYIFALVWNSMLGRKAEKIKLPDGSDFISCTGYLPFKYVYILLWLICIYVFVWHEKYSIPNNNRTVRKKNTDLLLLSRLRNWFSQSMLWTVGSYTENRGSLSRDIKKVYIKWRLLSIFENWLVQWLPTVCLVGCLRL